MGNITSSIQTFRHQLSSLVNSLEEKVQNLSSQQSDTMEEFSQIELLLSGILSKVKNRRKKLSLEKENSSLIEGIVRNMKKSFPDLIAAEKFPQKHFETCEKESEANFASLDDIASSVKTFEFTSQLDSVVSFHNSETSEIATFIKSNQQKEEGAIIDRIKDEIVTNKVVTQSNFETKKSKLKEIQGAVSENIKSNILQLDVQKNGILNTVSGAKAIIESSEQDLQKTSQELSKQILQRDIEIEKFISEDLEKDIPTGATPQRKTYCYPKELVQLSPDDEKLRFLRQFREDQTEKAATENLPMDSSFDDNDEFKSPFNPGFCEINIENTGGSVLNTSFNNGDKCFTDCETLSNASSTSDLSITGFKNKENCKNFRKPSHNIPKMKKIKSKVESSIPTPNQRKPLSSKNSSAFA